MRRIGTGRLLPVAILAALCLLAGFLVNRHVSPADDYRVERLAFHASSDEWESHPAFDPLTGDIWFVRSDRSFSGWRLMISRRMGPGWASAAAAPIAAPGLEADPFFSADGASLYFISTRATGAMTSDALDIWMAHRDRAGRWSSPIRLAEPVNSGAAEWFPRPCADGWLYFGSRRAGGYGKDDIWRARRNGGDAWEVENAGPVINSDGAEYEFEPSADGQWALLATDTGIFRVDRGPAGWERRTRLGPAVNATGNEIGPMLLPGGENFLFSRDAGDGRSGELHIAYKGHRPAWLDGFGSGALLPWIHGD